MSVTAPDWVSRRDGALKLGSDNKTWYLSFGGQPHYSLTPVPAQGKFSVAIRQTENGKRFESTGVYDSPEAAIRGGMDDLGRELGWL